MSVTQPTAPSVWEPIYPGDETQYDSDDLTAAQAFGEKALWALSGRRYGTFTTTGEQYLITACRDDSGYRWTPYLVDGAWTNVGCGGGGCCVLNLRNQPVRAITEVRVGGGATSNWFLTGSTISLTDGCPACSSTCPSPQIEVDYEWGITPDGAANMALGAYMLELVKGWSGELCKLSKRAQSYSRQGVSIELMDATTLIDKGRTGVEVVDDWLQVVNPRGLVQRSRVFSPDLPMARG